MSRWDLVCVGLYPSVFFSVRLCLGEFFPVGLYPFPIIVELRLLLSRCFSEAKAKALRRFLL